MNRFFRISTLFVLAGLAHSVAAPAKAGPVYGTQAFADTGTPSVVGSMNDSILNASGYEFGHPTITTTSRSGGFTSGAPFLPVTATTFTPLTPTSFILGSATFGEFTGISDTKTASSTTSVSYVLTGTFAPGSEFGGGPSELATLTVSFTQTGGPGTAISDSATLSTVPEPASIALLGLGLAGLGGISVLRRRRLRLA
jgi:hypothetical protein